MSFIPLSRMLTMVRYWLGLPKEPTFEQLEADAFARNNPGSLDGPPMNITIAFLGWLEKHRPGAELVIVQWLSRTHERMRVIPWGGDWLIYFPNLSCRDVPENVFKWFWFPAACPGKSYMYLRSHPSKLVG